MLGFKSEGTAWITLAGIKLIHMTRSSIAPLYSCTAFTQTTMRSTRSTMTFADELRSALNEHLRPNLRVVGFTL